MWSPSRFIGDSSGGEANQRVRRNLNAAIRHFIVHNIVLLGALIAFMV
jgi:hypothetical protein